MPAELDRPTSGVFAERLWPGPGVWLVTVGLAGMLTLSFVPVRLSVAVGVGLVALVAFVALGIVTAPRIEVGNGELRAGAAHISLALLGEVQVLDPGMRAHELGPALDARAHVCLRTWIGTAIRVEVTDPLDPTPYWIVSTRRPGALAAAVEQKATKPRS